MDVNEFKALMKLDRNKLIIISVIENLNTLCPFEIDLHLPLSTFDPKEINFLADKMYIFICHRGITSYTATELFKEFYPTAQVFNLKAGLEKY